MEGHIDLTKDGWYFFIDIVGSANPEVFVTKQLKKIEKVRDIILTYLKRNKFPEEYKSFTGDGMLIVFKNYFHPMELAKNIHEELKQYNSNLDPKDKVDVRIGIGTGCYVPFFDGVHEKTAPWGYELVLAQRIMDLAKPNQILLTDFAYQKIQNDYRFNKNEYGPFLLEMGKIIPKHQEKSESIYSFYKENEFGNNSDVGIHLNLRSFIRAYTRPSENLLKPLESFLKSRIKITIDKFEDIIDPSKGLVVGPTSTNLIYEVLFENGIEYISASYLKPSEFWELLNDGPFKLLYHHKAMLKKQPEEATIRNYRFLILEKSVLDEDILNKLASYDFINWHSINNVELYQAEPSSIIHILNKYPTLVYEIGIGLWYNKYVLQFGNMIEYTNPKLPNHPLKKRRFWLHDYNTNTYKDSVSFFNELKHLADGGKMVKVDRAYYNSVKDK